MIKPLAPKNHGDGEPSGLDAAWVYPPEATCIPGCMLGERRSKSTDWPVEGLGGGLIVSDAGNGTGIVVGMGA